MYYDFYHLKENPFNITADPDFFFQSEPHAEAFSHLEYGISNRKGIILLTGEIGTGKTTLCRTFLNRLNEKTKTALILNPNFTNVQLLQLILKDFGIESSAKNKYGLIEELNRFLLDETSKGHNVVVIIDEAQNLSVSQLEQIRLLSNLETEKEKLLQLVLIGQPELLKKLSLPSLRQLKQRIAVRYHVLPLKPDEMKHYIEHRLKVAKNGSADKSKLRFLPEAYDAIFDVSKGTPRLVNVLCDRALLAGFSQKTHDIGREIVYKSAREIL